MTNNVKGYCKALVVFIDILGSKNYNSFAELFKINELFHTELLNNKNQDRDYLAYQRHIYTFSDCAYLIYDYKDKSTSNLGALFNVALLNCEPLIMKFLSERILVRGGIAYDDVYYDENKNMFFGDAINRAYKYESEIAKFPRIIIDECVANEVIKYKNKINKYSKQLNYNESLFLNDYCGCIIKLDVDNRYYLNYFNSIQQGKDYSYIIGKSNKLFLEDLINMCDENIDLYKENDSIKTKYEWLKDYAEQSKNENINEVVEYTKPYWDKFFEQISSKQKSSFIGAMMLSNVGIGMFAKIEIRLFEKFSSNNILELLLQVGETNGKDK